MPFPKLSLTQIGDKEVAVVAGESHKLDHFQQHLIAAGHTCERQAAPFQLVYRGTHYEISEWLLVHGDIHEVSEIVRECWP